MLPLTSPTFSSRPSKNVLTVQRGVMKVSRLMPNIGSGAVVLEEMSRAVETGHRGELDAVVANQRVLVVHDKEVGVGAGVEPGASGNRLVLDHEILLDGLLRMAPRAEGLEPDAVVRREAPGALGEQARAVALDPGTALEVELDTAPVRAVDAHRGVALVDDGAETELEFLGAAADRAILGEGRPCEGGDDECDGQALGF